MPKVLVTGGAGYIGSHTVVDLLDHGFEVVTADNLSRSTGQAIDGIKKITGQQVQNYQVDLTELEPTLQIFEEHPDIVGIIHFAAYKTVPESVDKPLMYFKNNLNSLVNVLECVERYNVPHFVFSSSCSVYGNADQLPVTEDSPLKEAESPYARTKQMGEEIIQDFVKVHPSSEAILLRYFNPVGAHESAEIGETPIGRPDNLVPYITQTGIGIREKLTVFGGDYDTHDGTCIRDYIHVMDIANAHTRALQFLINRKNASNCEVFNLGTGKGVTVLEAVNAYKKVSGVDLNYEIGPRRQGDVVAIYADRTKATTELGWEPCRGIEEMMLSAWNWELKLAQMKAN